MAENWIIEQTVELTRPVQPYVGQPVELMLPGDHLAHTLRIKCKEKDMPVNLTGYTAAGYFKRTDGNTVLVVGSITGNVVDVTLSQECYAFPGNLRGVVRITNSTTDAKITLCDRLFHVGQAVDDGGTIDPGEVIPSLDDLLAEIDAMEQATAAAEAAADAVPDMVAPVFSTSAPYSAGSYVYYDGTLYRFTVDHAAGVWNSAQAVAVTIGGEVADLKSAVENLEDALVISISGTIEGEPGAYKYLRYTDGKTYDYLYESYVFTFSVDGINSFDYAFTTTPGLMGLAFYNASNQFITGSGVQAIATKQTVNVPSGAVTCKATVLSEDDISIVFNAGTIMTSVGSISSDVSAMNTATDQDEGKALKAKTVDNGKVIEWEFGNAGSGTDSELENKVFGITGTIDGSAGNYKYVHYLDGKVYSYANESYVYIFETGALTSFEYLFTMPTSNVLGLAFYDNSGTFISGSGVQAISTAQTVNVPANAVTCKATVLSKNDIEVLYSFQDAIEDIASVKLGLTTTVHTNYSLTPTTGYYVDYRDGKVSTNANMQYIQFPINGGGYIQYNSTIKNPDIRGLAFYNSYGSFISGYKMLSTVQTILIPADATLCKVTVNSADEVYLILSPADIADYADKKETFDILSAFENITCIGDSLTWSQVYLYGGTTRKAHKPWVDILGERTGATTEEIANPGYSASQWWTANASSIAAKTNQLAIINLGTNLGLSDTVDTDCVGDDPTNWGSTLTADYCRIVNVYKTVGAKIILVKPFTTTGNSTAGTTYADTFAAIDNIATRFGCGVVGPIYLAGSAYHKYPNGVGENAVHYNDFGYAAFADKLITGIAHMKNEFMVNIVPA